MKAIAMWARAMRATQERMSRLYPVDRDHLDNQDVLDVWAIRSPDRTAKRKERDRQVAMMETYRQINEFLGMCSTVTSVTSTVVYHSPTGAELFTARVTTTKVNGMRVTKVTGNLPRSVRKLLSADPAESHEEGVENSQEAALEHPEASEAVQDDTQGISVKELDRIVSAARALKEKDWRVDWENDRKWKARQFWLHHYHDGSWHLFVTVANKDYSFEDIYLSSIQSKLPPRRVATRTLRAATRDQLAEILGLEAA